MRKLTLAAAATAIAVAGGPALAADLRMPVKAPAVVVQEAFNWSGFYIGGHAGYGWGDARYSFLDAGHYNLAAGDRFTHRIDGFLAGGHLGVNWQSGALVLGLEGSATYSDVRGTAVSPFFPATDTFNTRLNWIATITPRLGYAAGPALFYVKGGVAFGEIRADIRDLVDFNRRSETRVGWTVGGGVEYGFASNWIVGVEANYYDFGRFNVNQESLIIGTNVPAGVFSNHNVRTDVVSVLGRLSYKFGGYAPVVASY